MAKEALKKAKKVGTVQFNFRKMINGRYEVDFISRSGTEPVFEIYTILLNRAQMRELICECDVKSCLQLHHPVFLADSVRLDTEENLIYFGEHYPVSFTCLVGGSEIVAPVGAFDFLSKSDIYIDFPPGKYDEPEQGEIPLS